MKATTASTMKTTTTKTMNATTTTTGVLHQIIAESPFERRLQHLYMADPKYQDIKAVEKAKLLEDIAKLIALDLHTNTNQAHKENWVGPTAMRTSFGRSSKQPTRCKA